MHQQAGIAPGGAHAMGCVCATPLKDAIKLEDHKERKKSAVRSLSLYILFLSLILCVSLYFSFSLASKANTERNTGNAYYQHQ